MLCGASIVDVLDVEQHQIGIFQQTFTSAFNTLPLVSMQVLNPASFNMSKQLHQAALACINGSPPETGYTALFFQKRLLAFGHLHNAFGRVHWCRLGIQWYRDWRNTST
jgi:hypothetical protein